MVQLSIHEERLRHPAGENGGMNVTEYTETIHWTDPENYRMYVRALIDVMIACAKEILGREKRVVVLHSLGGNLYSEIRLGEETLVVSEQQIAAIRQRMRQMVQEDAPIDTASSLQSAGWLQWFDLQSYEDGIILITPQRTKLGQLRSFSPQPKLFGVFQQSKRWSQILRVSNVSALNACVAEGKIGTLVQISEALHAKHIAEIASRVAENRKIKLILIAGPSSSGKTTFAQKLWIQLQAEGLRPHLISMDNYFINRDQIPYGPDGLQDFEAVDAVDANLFNRHMQMLLKGEEIELPTYNFKTGKREYNGDRLQLRDEDVLIVEGIHCLNESLSRSVPKEQKFKIYISAITMLNIDDSNRIPTTDGRLLRRMVRDHQHRGISAAETIRRWPSVRNGEERNIFPFQEEADVIFNSAHIYELAVLKIYAEPLLYNIQKEEPEYGEARRLIQFLNYFLGVSSELVPDTSIIREFIGGGIYRQ